MCKSRIQRVESTSSGCLLKRWQISWFTKSPLNTAASGISCQLQQEKQKPRNNKLCHFSFKDHITGNGGSELQWGANQDLSPGRQHPLMNIRCECCARQFLWCKFKKKWNSGENRHIKRTSRRRKSQTSVRRLEILFISFLSDQSDSLPPLSSSWRSCRAHQLTCMSTYTQVPLLMMAFISCQTTSVQPEGSEAVYLENVVAA